MNKINFEIITPEKIVFKDEIDSITLPASEGEITILPNHIPLVAPTKPGEIIIKKGTEIHHMTVMGGFIENSDNKVKLLADAAELVEEIDERRAEEARKRAELAKEKATTQVEFAEATAALERALTRIKIVRRKHRPRTM